MSNASASRIDTLNLVLDDYLDTINAEFAESAKNARIAKIKVELIKVKHRLNELYRDIEETKSSLKETFNKSSAIGATLRTQKSRLIDTIKQMEDLETEQFTNAMHLTALSVERSRLLRTIINKGAVLRKIDKHNVYNDELEKLWAEAGVFANKKCGLEQSVEKNGAQEVARILQQSPKADVPAKVIWL